jgi:predicted transcriptional regulator YdeE
VPAQQYAIFACTLPTLGETHSRIRTWLSQSSYQGTDGPEFELYGEEFDLNDESSEMHVYIPVQ